MEGINPGRTHNQSSDFASWDMKGKAPENGNWASDSMISSKIINREDLVWDRFICSVLLMFTLYHSLGMAALASMSAAKPQSHPKSTMSQLGQVGV